MYAYNQVGNTVTDVTDEVFPRERSEWKTFLGIALTVVLWSVMIGVAL